MTDEDPPRGAPGTGGLTLEPPPTELDDAPMIGFAPDLDEAGPRTLAPGPGRIDHLDTAPTGTAPRGGAELYPRALAAIAALLGEPDVPEEPGPPSRATAQEEGAQNDGAPRGPTVRADGSLDLGPPITHHRADVRRPPPPVSEREVEEEATSEHMEDMLEMVLVGGEDGEAPSVHLKFKEGYLGGLFLQLERTEAGLFARFRVRDHSDRRAVEGHVDMLLSRLRDRGLKVAGHVVVVGEE